jgi:DNA-binding NtrC family response regulator
LGLLAKAQSIDRDLAVILITGHGDVVMAVNAMRLGAYDFVEKPFPPDRLVEMARRAAENRRLILQVRALRAQLADQCGLESSILGSSPGIRRVSLGDHINRFERVLIEDALAEHHGNATYTVQSNVDLVVMGGFGHSRLRDFVLGGATKRVLTRPFTWTLVSH